MNRRITIKIGSLLLGAALLGAGCLGCLPRYEKPRRSLGYALPDQWRSAHCADAMAGGRNWLHGFGDDHLTTLVAEALQNNLEIKRYAALLMKTRAEADLAAADRQPQLEAGLESERGESPYEMGDLVEKQKLEQSTASLSAAWEIDVWGRLADLKSAALSDLAAARADLEAARMSLAAQVAKAWFDVLIAGRLMDLSEQIESNYELGAEKVRDRFGRGLVSALDMRLALTDLATARSITLEQKNRRQEAVRTLHQLLGRYPDSRLETGGDIPELSDTPPAGLPAELLERRPDVRAARRRVAAADHLTDAAHKSFLPQIRLTGQMGTASSHLRNLANADYGFWKLVGGLTQPIFQGGRLKAQWLQSRAAAREAWIDYARTVTTALAEVEQSLDREANVGERLAVAADGADQARAALSLAMNKYAAGKTDIITVLEAQRRSLQTRTDLLETRLELLKNRVDLHLALGGDFGISNEAGTTAPAKRDERTKRRSP